MNDDEKLQEIVKRAAAVAAGVPQALQEAAFNRAFEALLHPGSGGEPNGHSSAGRAARTVRETEGGSGGGDKPIDPVAAMVALPRNVYAQVDDETGAMGKALALLTVAENEAHINALTSSQIAQILTTKLKWKVSRQAINQAMDRAGRMVDSTSGAGARAYTIMAAGQDYLNTPIDERMAPSGSSGPRRRARASKAASSSKSKTAKPTSSDDSDPAIAKKTTPARRTDGRTGPREAVERLVGNGFFATPRTLGAIRTELRDSTAVDYKSTDLSPAMTRLLREGKLSRRKNEESQYEYVVGK